MYFTGTISEGVKRSQLGCTRVTVLLRGDTGGPMEGSSYSPGVTYAEYSLSSPKTNCHGEEPYPTRGDLLCRT
jgi:hypothetical protein